MSPLERDRAIAALAARQRGLVTRSQLADTGLHSETVRRWIAGRRLRRLHRGVYLLGDRTPDPPAVALAALLALGDEALLSHAWAGVSWEFDLAPPPEVTVTVVGAQRRSRRGIRVRCVPVMAVADRTSRGGLALTRPARTLLDLAAEYPRPTVEALVEDALARRIVSETALREALARSPHRRGAGALRAILDAGREPQLLRSVAERRLRDLIRAAGLPQPQANAAVAGYEVDLLWGEQRLAVELDSWRHHRDRATFERDRRKQSLLAARGIATVRVTYRRLTGDSHALVPELAAALARGAIEPSH